MKISYITITARLDFPYLGRPELHNFEPTMETFKQQTFRDFEWIIVDALYDQRRDYFKNKNLPFQVKHVPAKPNLWIEKGWPGISTQYNKGIIYADGELLFISADGYMVPPNFMENLWNRYRQGYFPFAWYVIDWSFTKPIQKYLDVLRFDTLLKRETSPNALESKQLPPCFPYNFLGYTGQNTQLEHRYTHAFKENNQAPYPYPAPWTWFFSCSSVSLEAMLKINGFDQKFDGDRSLMDCDVGSRLDLLGYTVRFYVFRDIYFVRAAVVPNIWNPNFKNISIKCNYALIEHSRITAQPRANVTILSDSNIQWIKKVWCQKACGSRDFCKVNHPWQYPFEHKAGYGHNSSKRWFNFWLKHQTLINLTEEREKRLNGDPKYQEGTFTEAI